MSTRPYTEELELLQTLKVMCCACRYMTMALMSHPKHTERLEDAELIIIYDYCFLMRAMAENHAHGHW